MQDHTLQNASMEKILTENVEVPSLTLDSPGPVLSDYHLFSFLHFLDGKYYINSEQFKEDLFFGFKIPRISCLGHL